MKVSMTPGLHFFSKDLREEQLNFVFTQSLKIIFKWYETFCLFCPVKNNVNTSLTL